MAVNSDDMNALEKAGKVFCDLARGFSAPFSRRIPAATRVKKSIDSVSVVTNGNEAPNAAPFEAGELHPLWAKEGSKKYEDAHWGKQPTRPYMSEAAKAGMDDAAEAYSESVMDYARRHGWD